MSRCRLLTLALLASPAVTGCSAHTQHLTPSMMPSGHGLAVDRGGPSVGLSATGSTDPARSTGGRLGGDMTVPLGDGDVDAVVSGGQSLDWSGESLTWGSAGARVVKTVDPLLDVSFAGGLGAAAGPEKRQLGSAWGAAGLALRDDTVRPFLEVRAEHAYVDTDEQHPTRGAATVGMEAGRGRVTGRAWIGGEHTWRPGVLDTPDRRTALDRVARVTGGLSIQVHLGAEPDPMPTIVTDTLERLLAERTRLQRRQAPPTLPPGPAHPASREVSTADTAIALTRSLYRRDHVHPTHADFGREVAAVREALERGLEAGQILQRVPADAAGGSLASILAHLRSIDGRAVPTVSLVEALSIYQGQGWYLAGPDFEQDLEAIQRARDAGWTRARIVNVLRSAVRPGEIASDIAALGLPAPTPAASADAIPVTAQPDPGEKTTPLCDPWTAGDAVECPGSSAGSSTGATP